MKPTIVVPLDGSGNAEQALPYAGALAKRTGGSLLLVSVVDIPVEFGAWSMASSGAYGAEVDRWLSESEVYLKRVAGDLDGQEIGTMVKLGSAAQEIRDIARTVDNAVIVMSSHGRTGAARLFLGSVATKLVHDADCPVLVIRIREQPSSSPPAFNRVLVPLDGSDFGEEALMKATAVLGEGLTLHLLRVIETPTIPAAGVADAGMALNYGLVEEYMDATRDLATQYLAEVQQRLAGEGHTVTVEVRDGQVADETLRVADEQRVDLIAMSTHGRGGLGRLVFGSVAERVLHESDRPLLLVRPA